MRFSMKLHAQGVLGNRLLVACGTQVPGIAGDNSTNRSWLFDPGSLTYEELPNAPKVVAKTVGAMVGEDLYDDARFLTLTTLDHFREATPATCHLPLRHPTTSPRYETESAGLRMQIQSTVDHDHPPFVFFFQPKHNASAGGWPLS
jgi:hypothetical protein